jgi:hypothetical protein
MREMAYCAKVINQYNGDSYADRSTNRYIDTGHYQIVTPEMQNGYNFAVWGGDTYVHNYDVEYVVQHWNNIFPEGFNDEIIYETPSDKISIAQIFPCESDYPFFLDSGYRWGLDRRGSLVEINSSSDKNDHATFETRTAAPDKYFQVNNIKTDLLAKDFRIPNVNHFPNRFRISEAKIDGEIIDFWRVFRPANFKDIEGKYGQINKITDWRDSLYYFQDRGHGVIQINQQSLISDSSGEEIVLGTGQILGTNKYLSTLSGTSHQQSVVATPYGLYYWDSTHKTINIIQGTELSKAKGLLSFFPQQINDNLLFEDLPHIFDKGSVLSNYDIRNNRVLFTFKNGINYTDLTGNVTENYYQVLDRVIINNIVFECLVQGDYTSNDILTSDRWKVVPNKNIKHLTLSYSEMLQAFESEYDYTPFRYLQFNNSMLSVNPKNNEEGYIHTNKAVKCTYFEDTYNSEMIFVVNPTGKFISTFDNIEYLSEISLDKRDLTDETLSKIHAWSEYQNTNEIPLVITNNIRRYLRTWRATIGRDLLSNNDARMRHYYIYLKITFDNNNNKRFVLNDIFVKYRPSLI